MVGTVRSLRGHSSSSDRSETQNEVKYLLQGDTASSQSLETKSVDSMLRPRGSLRSSTPEAGIRP